MSAIIDIPYELLELILFMTDGKTLLNCMQVCKKWRHIIHASEKLWKQICHTEFKYTAEIAKSKCGGDLTWYQLYRNLNMWSNITKCKISLTSFLHSSLHMLKLTYSVVPVIEEQGLMMYDMKYVKTVPVTLPCLEYQKISNNEEVTAIQMKTILIVQRNSNLGESEVTFEANKHFLTKNNLFFYHNKSIYKLNLKTEILKPELITNSNYDLNEIQYSDNNLYLYTACGRILTIDDKNKLTEMHIGCPDAWLRRIKHVSILNTKNYVCYSRNFIQIVTDVYHHLSIDFPVIMSLFFYGNVILIGTDIGDLLLYRLSCQKLSSKPIFSRLIRLPDACVALDVYERVKGPVIIAATVSTIYFIKVEFFPDEDVNTKVIYDANRLALIKRMVKVRGRLKMLL